MSQQGLKWMQTWSVLALLTATACATTPVPPPATGRAAVEEGPAFLWVVEDPHADREPLYLFGSVHLLKDGTAFPESLQAAIEETRVLAVEVDTTQVDSQTLQHVIQTRGMRTDGASVASQLPEALRPKLHEALVAGGLPPEAGEAMRPWVVSLVLSMQHAANAGLEESNGVETRLLSQLRDSHRIVEVEGFEAQINALADTPDEAYQYAIQRDLERGPEAALADLEEMARAWSSGDVAALERLVFDDTEDPRAQTLLGHTFSQRNARMAASVVALLEEGTPALVVVGAGHMVGTDGLPALLAARGFKVRQLGRTRASVAAGGSQATAH